MYNFIPLKTEVYLDNIKSEILPEGQQNAVPLQRPIG
jgi:hypothetical protein